MWPIKLHASQDSGSKISAPFSGSGKEKVSEREFVNFRNFPPNRFSTLEAIFLLLSRVCHLLIADLVSKTVRDKKILLLLLLRGIGNPIVNFGTLFYYFSCRKKFHYRYLGLNSLKGLLLNRFPICAFFRRLQIETRKETRQPANNFKMNLKTSFATTCILLLISASVIVSELFELRLVWIDRSSLFLFTFLGNVQTRGGLWRRWQLVLSRLSSRAIRNAKQYR